MSLTIELLPFQEQQIQQEAEREGVSVSEVIRRAIAARFPMPNGVISPTAESNAAPLSDEERESEERVFEQLHAHMNETRLSLGMRTI